MDALMNRPGKGGVLKVDSIRRSEMIEVIKELLGLGESMAGRLLIYDALGATFRTVKIKPDPECALCSDRAMITKL